MAEPREAPAANGPSAAEAPAPARLACVWGSMGHALALMLQHRRMYLAAALAFFPLLSPLIYYVVRPGGRLPAGEIVFIGAMDGFHINVLPPLLGLLLAAMLVSEHVEGHTLAYILTRPTPRLAWVFGRYLAYAAVAGPLLIVAVTAVYALCLTLPGFGFGPDTLGLAMHYLFAAVLAVLAYGGLLLFIGVVTRRPVVLGALIVYGWETLALSLPGAINLATLTKYIRVLCPEESMLRSAQSVDTALGGVTLATVDVAPWQAIAVLLGFTALCVYFTAKQLERKEFGGRASGV